MEKPRHLRILDRINSIADREIANLNFKGEGAVTVFKDGREFNISASSSARTKEDDAEGEEFSSNVPLKVEADGVSINIGLMENIVATLNGTSIYGTGTMESRPLLPKDVDADVWVKLTIIINYANKYYNSTGPGDPDLWIFGDISVLSATIETFTAPFIPTDQKMTFGSYSGSVVEGYYYKYIGSILDEEVFFDTRFADLPEDEPPVITNANQRLADYWAQRTQLEPWTPLPPPIMEDAYFRYTASSYFENGFYLYKSSEPVDVILS